MIMASQMETATPQIQDNPIPYPDPLNTFIWNAIVERATDVHLHSVDGGVRVLLRVDGVIYPKLMMPAAEGRRLFNQLKSAAGMNATRTFQPLEGHIRWPDSDITWDVRVTLTPTRDRESAHLRFLSVPTDQWNMTNLGFEPQDQDKIQTVIQRQEGLVLITGPTSSGKTTSMYCLASLLDLCNTTAYSIEDPVEFKLPYAQQIEVDERHGLTMHEGLRTILRMDPDMILVGEIRDQDSAVVAARAALSGRLVLATIHARNAAGAVDTLHCLGVPHHVIGASLRMIVGQKLVRRLCPDCAEQQDLCAADQALFQKQDMEVPPHHLEARGCGTCHRHGYRGRTGLYEVAPIGHELAQEIGAGITHHDLNSRFRDQGVPSILQDGLEKVAHGVTTLNELRRVSAITPEHEPGMDAGVTDSLETVAG
jgi:type II secretory ATPase GspE/PulE/Tfp pilus assembly ATPase PilB-like protein